MAYADPSISARATPAIANYSRTSAELGDIRVRLTTGNRVVRLGDDSASISTATTLQTQTSTLRSALTSGAKASSFLDVAAEGLSQIRTILESLQTLTNTANGSGVTTRQFAQLDAQFQSGLAAIDRVVATTTFNGTAILDGSLSGASAPTVLVADTSGDALTLALDDVSSAALFVPPPSLSDATNAAAATTPVEDAAQAVEEAIAKVEAYQLRLTTANAAVNQSISGTLRGVDGLIGTDVKAETQNETLLTLRQNTAAALLAQAQSLNSGLLGLLAG